MPAFAPRPLCSKHTVRGAATVELALVLPILVVMVLFSLFLTELVHGKLKLQEMSRYLAWELTSFSLTDMSGERGEAFDSAPAFATARDEAMTEAVMRYRDFDSVEDAAGGNFIASWDAPQADATSEPAPFEDDDSVKESETLKEWGFNVDGRVRVDVRTVMHNRLLPRRYLQKGEGGFHKVEVSGGANLSALSMHNSYYLLATDWHLTDGADANMVPGRAGRHGSIDSPGANHGLYRRVDRMRFQGATDDPWTEAPGGMAFVAIHFMRYRQDLNGTFVVSHRYLPEGTPGEDLHGCNYSEEDGSPKTPSYSGMNNLWLRPGAAANSGPGYPGVDGVGSPDPSRIQSKSACFETLPFREQWRYEDGERGQGSVYMELFRQRGMNFMACKNAQAEDVSSPTDRDTSDLYTEKVACER